MPIEQLKLMRQAGCISIDFAVESGSDVVLKTIKKRMTVEKIERFGMTCHELGIRANFFTMISLPDETREEAAKTFGIIKKLYQYEMRTTIAPLIIYPGLELETIARDRGVMPEGFSWFDRDYRCPYKYISPREYNMPHYLERFSEQDVLDYLEEFPAVCQRLHPLPSPKFLLAGGVRRIASIRSSSDLGEIALLSKRYATRYWDGFAKRDAA